MKTHSHMPDNTHRHWFHGMWFHLGEYGDQTVHVHPCSGDADIIDAALANGTERSLPEMPCDWAVIGVGRSCGGKKTRHWRQSLADRLDAQQARDEYDAQLPVNSSEGRSL